MNIYIYNKKCELIAKPIITSFEEFKAEPTRFYPAWDNNLIATEIQYTNPILEDGFIREKTREELITLDNRVDLLLDGEIIDDNKIIVIPKPNGYNIQWINQEWIEVATLEEQEESLRNRIISRTDELIKIQLAGFNNFELQKEIDTLRNSHLEITHQIAINSNL